MSRCDRPPDTASLPACLPAFAHRPPALCLLGRAGGLPPPRHDRPADRSELARPRAHAVMRHGHGHGLVTGPSGQPRPNTKDYAAHLYTAIDTAIIFLW
jgi:hypothetical protein